jgi:hypothetical protein
MTEFIIVTLICVVLSALFDSEKDTIQYKPFMTIFKFKWWTEQNYLIRKILASKLPDWLVKVLYYLFRYPLSFMINGWHFCKSTSLIFLFLPVAIFNPYFEWYYLLIAIYIFYGIAFNISYDY